MGRLTKNELHDRQVYYQGYCQCFEDIMNIFKELRNPYNDKTYVDVRMLVKLSKAMNARVMDSFDLGYMYYDEQERKFKYSENLDKAEVTHEV